MASPWQIGIINCQDSDAHTLSNPGMELAWSQMYPFVFNVTVPDPSLLFSPFACVT
jgi:hypothetical protein